LRAIRLCPQPIPAPAVNPQGYSGLRPLHPDRLFLSYPALPEVKIKNLEGGASRAGLSAACMVGQSCIRYVHHEALPVLETDSKNLKRSRPREEIW